MHNEKVLIMRVFIAVLILIFNLQSWIKADDVRDFEIEGMSIGVSALDYYSRKEIKDYIKSTDTFEYKDRKFVQIGTYKNTFETFEHVGLVINPNDKNFEIYAISGQFNYGNDIDKCYDKQKEISKDIENFLVNYDKKNQWDSVYEYDPSGASKVKNINYSFKDKSEIRIMCYDMSENFKHDPNDALYLSINSAEFINFIDSL
tara:strand:- start:877 stop:1485 length:609 start_codon:yes stop_codon:yes gene_type:complete